MQERTAKSKLLPKSTVQLGCAMFTISVNMADISPARNFPNVTEGLVRTADGACSTAWKRLVKAMVYCTTTVLPAMT